MIYFVHIPKTAGTTIVEIMKHIYGDRFQQGDIERGKDRFPTDDVLANLETHFAGIDAFSVHMPYGLHAYLNRDYHYMTFLREPIARSVSHYNFLLRSDDKWSAYLSEHGFEGMFKDDAGAAWRNMQTRFLAGRHAILKPDLDASDLELAKQHLENDIDLLGIVELFDESIVYFKQILKWQDPLYLRANQSDRYDHPKLIKRSQLSETQLALAQEHNQLDAELYAFGRQVFEQRIASRGEQFHREVAQFKRNNQLYYFWRVGLNKLRSVLPR